MKVPSRQSQIQTLEARRLFATFTVTNLLPSGPGSLAATVDEANLTGRADIVKFAANVRGTIQLSATIPISQSLDIRGPGADQLTIHAPTAGDGDDQAFHVEGDGVVTASIAGLTITGGEFDEGGGAIGNFGELTVENCVISESGSVTGEGGGILSSGGALTVRNSTFLHNAAEGSFGGGAICVEGGSLLVDACTFEANDSRGGTEGGGAIAVTSDASGVILNSTFSGNTQGNGLGGGAILLDAGRLTIENCTIANNSTVGGNDTIGGGVLVQSGLLTLRSTIIADNTTDGPADSQDLAVGPSGAIDAGNSLIESVAQAAIQGGSVANVLGVDPQLAPLADNGGPTQTIALAAGSPAIDAGSNPVQLTTDQRGAGFARSAGAGVDMGAFEVQSQTPAPVLAAAILTTFPAPLLAGSNGALTLSVSNKGLSPFSGRATINVYATTGGVLNGDEVLISQITKKLKLAVDQAKPVKDTLRFPVGLDGTFFLMTRVDVDDVTGDPTLGGLPTEAEIRPAFVNLDGEWPIAPTAITNGGTLNGTLILTNKGLSTAKGTIQIALFVSQDDALDTDDLTLGAFARKIRIKPAGQKTVRVNFKLPTGITPGNYHLFASLDSTNTIVESDEDNVVGAGLTTSVT